MLVQKNKTLFQKVYLTQVDTETARLEEKHSEGRYTVIYHSMVYGIRKMRHIYQTLSQFLINRRPRSFCKTV